MSFPDPRIYADANIPVGVVEHMRTRLKWDVLFVLEEPRLRRAPDIRHYRLAEQLRRTLVTMDRDYLDDDVFPPAEGGGVLVINAPDERLLCELLDRVDRLIFRSAASEGNGAVAPPLAGRKLRIQTDWGRDE